MAGNPNWVKGKSGNPGGRPKIAAEFKERARQRIDAEGFEILVSMMTSGLRESEDRRYALTKLLEYAYGKPQQHVDVTSQGESFIKKVQAEDYDAV